MIFTRNSCPADRQTLVTSDHLGRVRFWRPDTGEMKLLVQGHESREIRKAVFSPDGKTLATAGVERSVRLWCAVSGHEQLRFPDLSHTPSGLAFSPDGQRLAAALHDGTVRIWSACP
jgi:WD40 repeat protein